MADAPNQRLCKNCKEWYDARAPACYLCGEEASKPNEALVVAQMNGALARQVGYAQADQRAQQQFDTARRTNNADLANRPLRGYPGYGELVGSIKRKLQESGFGE